MIEKLLILFLIPLLGMNIDPVEEQFYVALYTCLRGSDDVEEGNVYLELERKGSSYEIKKMLSDLDFEKSSIDLNEVMTCFNGKDLSLQASSFNIVISIINQDKTSSENRSNKLEEFVKLNDFGNIKYELFVVNGSSKSQCGPGL